jgi:hypothetical protein
MNLCGYLPCNSCAWWETKRYYEDSRSYQALARDGVAFIHQDLWCHHESLILLLISGGAQQCGKRSDTYHTLRVSDLSHSRLLFRTCSSLWRRNTPPYIFSKAHWYGYFIRIQGTVVLQTSLCCYHVATEYFFWYQYNALPYLSGLFHKTTSPVISRNGFSDWSLLQRTSDERLVNCHKVTGKSEPCDKCLFHTDIFLL